ncbi:hypothetical protein [Planctellipticum variicoloris]|uniref:hypothetical protein n=1 Tax=Planctellipticum variicoloris TaxID=3064265 RepID=UPI003013519A|nr:hypothetical protein SH412_002967 [Planctomycetaceae bacterium SH412]
MAESDEVIHRRRLSLTVKVILDMQGRAREAIGVSTEEADQWERSVLEALQRDNELKTGDSSNGGGDQSQRKATLEELRQRFGDIYRVQTFEGHAETDPPESPFAGDAVIAALASLEERYAKRRFPSAISGAVESLRQLFNDGPILQTDARSVMEPASQILNWLSQELNRLTGAVPKDKTEAGTIPEGIAYDFDWLTLANGKRLRLSTCQFCAVKGGAAVSCPKAYPSLPLEWVEKLRRRLMELKLIAADESPWYVGNQATPEAICWCSLNGVPKNECIQVSTPKPPQDGESGGNKQPDINCKPSEPTHSPDFASVNWFGTPYKFTPTQSACVRVLWEAWENRTPDVGQDTILVEAGSNNNRLYAVFRGNRAWGVMIITSSKGRYRLNAEPPAHAKMRT